MKYIGAKYIGNTPIIIPSLSEALSKGDMSNISETEAIGRDDFEAVYDDKKETEKEVEFKFKRKNIKE